MTTLAASMTSPGRQPGLFDIANGAGRPASTPDGTPIVIAGRTLATTVVFDTYWRFAAARQDVYEARIRGAVGPWTRDPILAGNRFTNCFRAADRVSQYLIGEVSYAGSQDWSEVFFRTLLFKLFNKVSTWQLLRAAIGPLTWADFDFRRYSEVLDRAFQAGTRLYSAAYVVPPPALGEHRKHANHLRLVELMMHSGAPERVLGSPSMREAFHILRDYPSMGNFLAYQFLIDLNYSAALRFEEAEFVVAGPGARDGIRKCFGPDATGIEADVIRYMADHQDEHFTRLGLPFAGLYGRPLQLIDCQNLFCEVDKYARVAHPEIVGHTGRSRIKQRFQAANSPLTVWFPPKWGINAAAQAAAAATVPAPRHPAAPLALW